MSNSIWSKKIPTFFGLVLLLMGILTTTYLTKQGIIFNSKASPAHTPQNVRITNVTNSTFTVSYTTPEKTTGIVSYGTDKTTFPQNAIDQRDQSIGELSESTTYSIIVKDLRPSTTYYFTITSGSDTYLNNQEPFMATTSPTTPANSSSTASVLSGKVIHPDGSPASGAIVYVASENSQTLSNITSADGTYQIPLGTILTKNLQALLKLSPTTILNVLITTNTSQSNITLIHKSTNGPIPVVTLSQDYDFSTSILPIASSSAQIGFPSFLATTQKFPEPKIVIPKKDQTFTDQRPVFRGITQPNTSVTITIESENVIEERITSDNNGNWSYRPTTNLTPGQHTLTATTRDQYGILKKISQTFTVFASGSMVEKSATPSASPTTKPTNTPTPTTFLPTPTSIILTPTTFLTPTNAPIQVVTTAVPTPPVETTKGGTIVEPGTSATTLGIGAALTAISGLVLFFFTKGFPNL